MISQEDTFHLGAKALIQNKEGLFLLLQKASQEKLALWDLPGGRIHKNETLENALKREVFEETGLQNLTQLSPLQWLITPLRIPVENGDVGLIIALYTCEIDENSPIRLSNEHLCFEWVDPIKAAEMLPKFYPADLFSIQKQVSK